MPGNDPEPKRLTGERLEFVRERARSGQQPKKIAKALEVPVRLVERALRELGDKDALRRARIRLVLMGLLALGAFVASGYGIHLMMARAERARADEDAKRREAQNRAIEDRIYQVLDKREPGHDDEVAAHLESDDEAIRLGSVRYLLLVGRDARFRAALDHVFDRVQRIRLATIQLAAKRPSAEVDEVLAAAAARPELELAERILALDALKERPPSALLAVSAKVLEVVADRQEGLRRAAHELLARAFPRAAVTWSPDGPALQAAWRSVLMVRR